VNSIHLSDKYKLGCGSAGSFIDVGHCIILWHLWNYRCSYYIMASLWIACLSVELILALAC